MRISSYHFNPGILSTLVTIALLYIMVSLGFWQLDRAEFKNALQQKISARKNLAPVVMAELPGPAESRRYRPVKLTGNFDAQHSFLLDNITFKGHVGYYVLTPVKLDNSRTILVSRGFVRQGKTRNQLPDISPPDGTIAISGILDFAPSRTLLLAENVQETSRWPIVLQYVDLHEISGLLDDELYDMILWLAPDGVASFDYDLPVLNLNSAKNEGYAFQWFAMSLALAIIYIAVNTKKKTMSGQ